MIAWVSAGKIALKLSIRCLERGKNWRMNSQENVKMLWKSNWTILAPADVLAPRKATTNIRQLLTFKWIDLHFSRSLSTLHGVITRWFSLAATKYLPKTKNLWKFVFWRFLEDNSFILTFRNGSWQRITKRVNNSFSIQIRVVSVIRFFCYHRNQMKKNTRHTKVFVGGKNLRMETKLAELLRTRRNWTKHILNLYEACERS